jgi:asparagine synthase (glutamine-hydrolysing)
MCGICGHNSLSSKPLVNPHGVMDSMNELQKHRGPDGRGVWVHNDNRVSFGHVRLSIIDLSDNASQPMADTNGNYITFNGEIYNYIELRKELGLDSFKSNSDTEVILKAYDRWGESCVDHFRGMFAFALWDENKKRLFCSRDRFGIKPFYYTISNGNLFFASEIKAILPYSEEIETDKEGLKDYLTFQFCLEDKTLFKGIKELLPAHSMIVKDGKIIIEKYWEVFYEPDFDHTEKFFQEKLSSLLLESVDLHLRSDVPIGAYLSGGLDSSLVSAMSTRIKPGIDLMGFNGKFSEYGIDYDESMYAESVARNSGIGFQVTDISSNDFIDNILQTIYHLDFPIAGPGVLSQFMVSKMASKYRKVVLGGQGGDEIFGGYTRYLVAYFEQCIKGAIDGTINDGRFVLTYESIIPNLTALHNYKPMLKKFWSNGLFEDMSKRYFQLINRSPDLGDIVNWDALGDYSSFDVFSRIFNGNNVGKESYLDQMTHFDFKTLLPALLQVEDRVSMAWGIESRVPFLDHKVVELAASMPANIKLENGQLKHILHNTARDYLPAEVLDRKDKKGFPTPFNQWVKGDAKDFVYDIFNSTNARNREYIDNSRVIDILENESKFSRNIWGLLSLELWHKNFQDNKLEIIKKRVDL